MAAAVTETGQRVVLGEDRPIRSRPLAAVRPGRAARGRQGAPRRGGRRRPGRDPRAVAPDPRQPGAGVRGAPGGGAGSRSRSRGHGFAVEQPAGRLATAIRADAARRPRRRTRPRIGILAEYDALPGLGHGCGHNTMAASGVGAAIALASIADELPGEIVFLGTPAEERGSGKQIMIEDGLFDGLDAALLYHPCDRSHVASPPARVGGRRVVFTGLQAHAASDPWKGRNALDAMILLFSSVGLWRQQLRRTPASTGSSRRAAPPRTSSRTGRGRGSCCGAPTRRTTRRCGSGSTALADAAALATGTTVEVTFSGGAMTMQQNRTLEARWVANAAAYGVVDQGPDPNSGSTDMGNVSWVCPTIHPELAICDEGTPGHSLRFRDAAATPRPTRRRCWRRRSSPRPPTSCSPTRRSSTPPGASSAAGAAGAAASGASTRSGRRGC